MKKNRPAIELEVGTLIRYNGSVVKVTYSQLVSADPIIVYLELSNGENFYSPETALYEIVDSYNQPKDKN